MKQQKLVYVTMNISDKSVELPLQGYLNDGWTIESYQPVATRTSMNVVVLLTKEN